MRAHSTHRLLDGMSRLSAQQWLLRAAAPAGAAVVLLLERAAGGTVQPWFMVVALAQSLLVAALPDTGAALYLMMLLGVHWAVYVPAAVTGWVLGAALTLLVVHLSVTLASYGPPSLVLHRALLLRWARRGLLVAGGTVLVWLAARLWPTAPSMVAGWAVGAALLVLLVWAVCLTRLLGPRR